MTRIGEFRGVPWRGLLAAGAMVLALSVGLARGAGAATRFVATTGNDVGNTCLASGSPCKTITHALTQKFANDTISVTAGTYNLALGESFPLVINQNLTLTGAGAGSTILDAAGANTNVITINLGVTAAISGVTITGGNVSCSGTGCMADGGGLVNSVGGTLTLTASTVSGNMATCTTSGDGACEAVGGGLLNNGTLTLTASTVSGNTASCTNSGSTICDAFGGGLANNGTLTLTNSTVSGNAASCTNSASGFCTADGGGLFASSFSPVTLTNVTLSGNAASCGGGCAAQGGGFKNGGTVTNVTLKNTLVANNPSGGNCFGSQSSLGHNLSSDASCGFAGPGDLNSTDPKLGPLQNNGGFTATHALLPGQPGHRRRQPRLPAARHRPAWRGPPPRFGL